jgi:DNA replication and repair protein RecF
VTGPNGAGKTNLLESLHVGTQGFSPRTRSDRQLIRQGTEAARVELTGRRGTVPVSVSVSLSGNEPRRARLDGAVLPSAADLRGELATLVFTPDRLVVVKGGPAARRAYFDRSLGRLYPARAHLSLDYAAAIGQRNAALRRVAMGVSHRDALAPWTTQVADLGAMLTAARRDVVELLRPGFAERAGELGLAGASLGYDAEPPTITLLEERLDRDIDRGTTGAGPHLDEFGISSGNRDLRTFGSQGEQRLAMLALLLAEAELIAARRKVPPLLLLDDALSELDESRRQTLSERIGTVGQTIVTATGPEALPLAPAQLLRVTPGRVTIA